jgi:glucan phosphoethanolaminetransferase (alkaline phosphatase superfamily)
MEEVFAGFVSGYIMALIFSGLIALMVVERRSRIPYLAKVIAPNISAAALAVPISLIAFLLWTAIGMLLGLLYRYTLQEAPGGGLGSPNLLYTLLIISFAGLILTAIVAAFRRLPWQVGMIGLSFIVLFGWVLPLLAQAAK